MAEIKRGYAMLLTAGDEQISKALADGILAVRWTGDLIRIDAERRDTFPIGGRLVEAKPLNREEAQVVSAEMDRQKIADYLRVAMHREPVDYAALAFDAEMRYGESVYEPGPLKRAAEKMLVGWALICLGFHELFRSVGTEERT